MSDESKWSAIYYSRFNHSYNKIETCIYSTVHLSYCSAEVKAYLFIKFIIELNVQNFLVSVGELDFSLYFMDFKTF